MCATNVVERSSQTSAWVRLVENSSSRLSNLPLLMTIPNTGLATGLTSSTLLGYVVHAELTFSDSEMRSFTIPRKFGASLLNTKRFLSPIPKMESAFANFVSSFALVALTQRTLTASCPPKKVAVLFSLPILSSCVQSAAFLLGKATVTSAVTRTSLHP